MKIKNIVLIFVLFTASLLFAGDKRKNEEKWLKQEYAKLAKIKTIKKLKNVGLWMGSKKKSQKGLYSYFPNGNGLILFDDKTWVLLVSHSSHANDGLGDLTLIRASNGNYYLNRGHVCSKLILRSTKKINSLQIFLKTKGLGDIKKSFGWEIYKATSPQK